MAAASNLKPAVWTAFAKKRELDDGAFVKALTALDRVDEDDHDDRLEALEEVMEQAKKMIVALPKRKPPLPDKEAKEVKDKLYSFHDDAEREMKNVRSAKASADAGDEDEDSPALLSSKMIPLLRSLRKPGIEMHAMIGTAGKETAVLIMRKPIAPARRKLLGEALDAKGGAKYINATCLFENNALTFVVQSPAGGLAKKIRAALLNQTDLRVKVRVRGEDGAIDDDGEEDEQGAGGGPGGDDAEGTIPEAPPQPEDPAEAFEKRRRALMPDYEAALKAQHPEATKLRALMGFVSDKADRTKDYPAATKALEQIEKVLNGTASSPTAPSPGPAPAPKPSDDRGAAFTARLTALLDKIKAAAGSGHPNAETARQRVAEAGPFARKGDWDAANHLLDLTDSLLSARVGGVSAPAIVYTQSRLAWGATRKKIQAELLKLEKAILDTYKDNEGLAEVAKGVRKLDSVLAKFDEKLEDKLDAALNATDPAEKLRWHEEAREVIATYQGYLKDDPIVRELDANPFVPITVQATLTTTLSTLASKIV